MYTIKLNNEKDKQACTEAIQDFLQESIGVQVHVDDYYTIGGIQKSIVLILQTMQEKKEVLRNKKRLKDVRVNGQKVFINEFLPPTALEKKRKDQDIADTLQSEGAQAMYINGQITDRGKVYLKKVRPPTPRELINIPPQEIDRILKIKTARGDQFIKSNSKFIGYTAEVTSHEQINDIYRKMKMIKPSARHIVCAYSINCDEAIYARDYHDDGEPGAGRLLLDLLIKNGIQRFFSFLDMQSDLAIMLIHVFSPNDNYWRLAPIISCFMCQGCIKEDSCCI